MTVPGIVCIYCFDRNCIAASAFVKVFLRDACSLALAVNSYLFKLAKGFGGGALSSKFLGSG